MAITDTTTLSTATATATTSTSTPKRRTRITTTELPLVDSHTVAVDAAPDAVWDALWSVLRRSFGGSARSRRFGRVVGVRDTEPLVGFRIDEEERGRRLVLEGEHRFSRYRLAFELSNGRLEATTHAAFPDPHGKLYRALIVPTRFHARVVNRILRASARAAAREAQPSA